MFNRIVDWAVTNRLLVAIALITLTVSAFFIIPRLNLDAFPDVTNVQVSVNTEAPGLAAEEVEQLITYPIEAVMYALPDVEQVRSISKTGLSGVTVVFKEGTDIYFARQLVFERLQAAKTLIPQDVGTPQMGPNTSGLGQVFQYLLVAEPGSGVDAMALRSINDWLVKLMLMPVDGVTDVLSFGGQVKQYQVHLDPNKLLSYRLAQQDVLTALKNNNVNVGGWYMARGQEQLVVRGTGWYTSGEAGLAELRQVPIKTVAGTAITIADVASVSLGSEIRQGAVTMTKRDAQGKTRQLGEVVTGIVLKRMGANTKATIDGIKSRLAAINRAMPNGVRLEPFYDQSDLIGKAVDTLVTALSLAFVFISLVLALFLMNLRATILVLLSIPISIGLALMIMAMLGLSANLMSLGGIAVTIGMLVDGSVVMVESINQRIKDGLATADAIFDGATSRLRPVLMTAITSALGLIPMLMSNGLGSEIQRPLASVIVGGLITATLLTLFVVPCLYKPFSKGKIKEYTQ